MRYERGRKRASRQRIVDAAAALFRREGIQGAGIAAIMDAARLTHGGFYAHFASKEALVCAALDAAASRSTAAHRAAATDAAPGRGLSRIVARYLSRAHRDRPEDGCILPSLTPEIARQPAAVRALFTQQVRDMLTLVREQARAPKPEPAALQVLATLVGALQLARAVDDPELSSAFLAHGRRAALRLAGEAE